MPGAPWGSIKRRLQDRVAAWVRRRQGEDTVPFNLHRRRIYILPTRGGVGFGALLVFMLLAGLNYASSLALFFTFLLAGFGLVAMHQCHRNLLGLAVLGTNGLPAFAGQTGTLQVLLANPAGFARYRIEADLPDEGRATADLEPGARAYLDLPVATSRRGILRVERMRLSTTHPFGLFRAWTWVHMPLELLVYPRARGKRPMPSEADLEPGARARAGSGTDEWYSLRAFRDGDSPRQVAWKAYARGAPLLVKEYTETASDERVFDFARVPEPDVERRLEQLARWIVDAEAGGNRYGLRMPASEIPADRGREHRHKCLAALALHGHPVHGTHSDAARI